MVRHTFHLGLLAGHLFISSGQGEIYSHTLPQ